MTQNRSQNSSEKIIEEMHKDFNKKIKENQDNVNLDNKIKGMFESIEGKFSENCKAKIDEIQKYEESNVNKMSKEEVEKANSALQQLEDCRRPYMNLINNFSYISQYTKKLFKMQTESCYQECNSRYGSKENFSDEDLRGCINQCNNFSEKFAFKASSELLGSTCDDFKNQLKKL